MSIDYGGGAISMLTEQTRYIGIADLYDEQGAFHDRVGIPVEHIMWQRLLGTLEYVDGNDNGLFDIDSNHAIGTLDEMENTAGEHEEILRWVDYRDVSWQLSDWEEGRVGNDLSIDFVLSAEDVPYGDGVEGTVDRIAYLFHVTTVEGVVEVDAVRHFRVDYSGDPEDPSIRGSEKVAETAVTGHVLNSTWKYDQHIAGWDVAERNDTRLFTLTEMAMGAKLHPAVGQWMRQEYGHLLKPQAFAGHRAPAQEMGAAIAEDHDLQGNPLRCGLAYVEHEEADARAASDAEREKVKEKIREYRDTACRQRGEEIASGVVDKPEVIRAGGLHFEDDEGHIGRIRWVSNATVDDVETEVLFQLHGARPVVPDDLDDNPGLFIGIRMLGGYNYVAGNDSFHDPEFGAEVLTIDTQSFGTPIDPTGRLPIRLIGLAAAGLIVLVALGTAVRRRPPAPLPEAGVAPTPAWATAEADWDAYREG